MPWIKVLNSLIQGRKLLPLSDLRGLHSMKELPKKIGNLIHLKWLSLRGGGITRLPKSMGKLFNLLILDMHDSLLKGYPIQFEYYMNRNIYMVIKSWFWAFFQGVGQLANLQILDIRWGDCLKDDGLGKLKTRQDPMLSLEKLPNLKILKGSLNSSL